MPPGSRVTGGDGGPQHDARLRSPAPSPHARYRGVLRLIGWAIWFSFSGAAGVRGEPTGIGADRELRLVALWGLYGALNTALLWTVLRAAVRRPVLGRHARRHLGAQIALALGTSALCEAVDIIAYLLLGHGEAEPQGRVLRHLPGYLLLTLGAHAIVYARRVRRAARADARLRERLARAGRRRAAAEVRALTAELPPLLLTEAVATAGALVRTDPAGAQRVLVELGVLMRDAVARSGTPESTLDEELGALRSLVTVAGARQPVSSAVQSAARAPAISGAMLREEVDPELRDLPVPHLVLQPLVAYAARRAGRGDAITVRAWLDDEPNERLTLQVSLEPGSPAGEDEAPAAPAPDASGIAAEEEARTFVVLRQRLATQFGTAAELRLSAPGARVVATLVLPQDVHAPAPSPCLGAGTPTPTLATGGPAAARSASPSKALERWLLTIAHPQHPLRSALRDRDRRDPAAEGARVAPGTLLPELLALTTVMAAAATRVLLDARSAGGSGVEVVRLAGHVLWFAAVLFLGMRVARRWPLGVALPRRILEVHGGVALLVGIVTALAPLLAVRVLGLDGHVAAVSPSSVLAQRFVAGALLCLAFMGVADAMLAASAYWRSLRVLRGLRGSLTTTSAERSRAELRAIKAELNPHFVGNALHTAAALVPSDAAAAEHMLAALAALAREATARADTVEVTLAEELASLDPFLALERARLGLRDGVLRVTWDVPPDVLDARVPHLLLQPLVENAVRHGLAPRGGVGRLTVRARRVGGGAVAPVDHKLVDLELAVVDDGVGVGGARPHFAAAGSRGMGCGAGTRSLRERLSELYGARATFALLPVDGGGTEARLRLPYRVTTPAMQT